MGSGLADGVASLDALVGDGIERAVLAKHRRRLARLGSGALQPPAEGWADGDPPPRDGCTLEVLVDGARAFPELEQSQGSQDRHRHADPTNNVFHCA